MRAHRIVLAGLLAAGCGGSGNQDHGDGGSGENSVSQMVTAAAGGTVSVGATGASLVIPASSLAGDTTITATAMTPPSSLPMASTLQGKYYDFGPSGTTFSPAASLTLPLAASPATGMTAVISWYDGTQWNDLVTTVANGSVTAPVAHFTGFVVRVVTGTGHAVDCSTVKTPCGGDLTGTWNPSTVCPQKMEMLQNCPNSTAVLDDALSGTAVFNAAGTYTLNLPYTETFTGHFSPECLMAHPFADCPALQAALRASSDPPPSVINATCTGTAAAGCDCTGTGSGMVTANQTGTYSVSGTTFTTTPNGGSASSPSGFCVDGDTLWVQDNKSGTADFFAFTR
jgi:hypothetical protein